MTEEELKNANHRPLGNDDPEWKESNFLNKEAFL